MKPSRKRIAVVVLGLLFLADEYPLLRFRGDGRFSGGPVFGYWIRMRRIPLYNTGEYVFHFRGAPNEEMSLQLYAEGKGLADEAEIAHLKTNIQASLTDQNGRTICAAQGSPFMRGGRDGSEGWVTMLGPDEAAYWNGTCLRMRLKSSDSYILKIQLRDIDPSTPKINLIPTLEGGQPDLP
jgi:hypothetical protein